jgi:hypothetical protein
MELEEALGVRRSWWPRGSCTLGCLCLRLFCSVARTSHKSYSSAVGWTLLLGWVRGSGSGSGESVICANRLKAEREVRGRLVLGRACWLNGSVGFADGSTSSEPTDHSVLGCCRRSELAARREVNAIIHHLGTAGSDISHGDRALASEVARLSAGREAVHSLGGMRRKKKEAASEANEIGSVSWTQDRQAEAGTGLDCYWASPERVGRGLESE